MKKVLKAVFGYLGKSDWILLLLSLISSAYGIILISSALHSSTSRSGLIIQIVALVLGIFLYIVFSLIDIDIIADKSLILFAFCIVLISTLFVWGVAGDSGNRAWIRFGPIGIQPAEIVKIPFIIIIAKMMTSFKEGRGLSKPVSVISLAAVFGIIFVLIIVSSADLGSALVYMFIFVVMLFLGGVNIIWFGIAIAAGAVAFPLAWKYFLSDLQKDRILAPYDSSVDPTGLGITWQANQSQAAISAGGFRGAGLYNGGFTQSQAVPQQHTDFIFSVAGEEFGFIGALVVILLLLAIIIRCFYVGVRSNNTLSFLVCTGISAMFLAQMLENIGMCIGLTPVIGLTLPFFSYGGSSVIVNYAAIGIVSGVMMRPRPQGSRRI
ncbi:MAG: FtsW/RodA/SpoVE family cell cycle protein [Clostridia bacterium]|nr:FtsW/RodA/SpoVE family cell cycle protein [Clostridia bacterium]